MSKVLLVNPQTPYNDFGLIHPPLGLGYLSANLKKHHHEVECLDMPIDRLFLPDLKKMVDLYRPDVIGITSVTHIFADACEAAKACKEVLPHVPIVFGGVHVTYTPKETLERHPYVDFVMLFEAEFIFVELVERLQRREDVSRIAGLGYRKNNRVVVNAPEAPWDRNLIPIPDRSIFPMTKYLRNDVETTIITSWSCPARCVFCSTARMGRSLRYREVDNVIKEMKQLEGMGFYSLFISDDSFTSNRERVIELCDAMIREGIKLQWTCNMRAAETNVDMLRKMKEAGCYRVFTGFESLDREVLKKMRKGSTPNTFFKHVDNLNQVGIELHASFIVGAPGEDEETILGNLELIRQINPRIVTFNNITVYPGTPIHDDPDKYGLIIKDPHWYEKKDWVRECEIGTDLIPPEKVQKLLHTCHVEFYFGT
jgi:radical SAM superfamily enzyme YgiQ (UPF0313 family)